jgi:glutamate carboxypeptidase
VSQPDASEILRYLRARQGEMVSLLRDLGEMETPSLLPETQTPILARLAAELEASGLRARRLSGRTSGGQLLAVARGDRSRRSRRSGGAQLLLGHCDTVWPLGTLATMPVELRDGRLSGPGVYDMKAGLVQGIFALRALRDLGLEPPLAPVFFINSDEEVGSLDSTARIRRLARCMQRVFVLEPALGGEGKLKTERKGVGRFRVTVRGRAAHAGLDPEKGASAILELAHTIQALHALSDPERGITVNVGVISGGMRSNVIAPEAHAEIDVRVLRSADAEGVTATILGLRPTVPGTSLEIEGAVDRPPLERTPRNRELWHVAERCAAELGLEIGEGSAGGGSDGNTTSPITATLDGLGAVGDGAHAVHEHVIVERMPERSALLARLLMAPP